VLDAPDVDPGSAPVAVLPVEPGTQGFITPVLSVLPVPIDALLAPVPEFPESEEVAAMVVCVEGFCVAIVAVRLQAAVAEGGVCANAAAEMATPIASEAEKINRDIISSKISLPRGGEVHLRVAGRYLKPHGNLG
jgi:hypothetical protein